MSSNDKANGTGEPTGLEIFVFTVLFGAGLADIARAGLAGGVPWVSLPCIGIVAVWLVVKLLGTVRSGAPTYRAEEQSSKGVTFASDAHPKSQKGITPADTDALKEKIVAIINRRDEEVREVEGSKKPAAVKDDEIKAINQRSTELIANL